MDQCIYARFDKTQLNLFVCLFVYLFVFVL